MIAVTLAILFGGIILIGFILRKYSQRNQDYWKIRGVTALNQDVSGLKSLFQIIMKTKNVLEFDKDTYNELGSKPYGGTVDFGKPGLLIKDPELIKQVLVKDFDHFVDRRKVEMHSEPILSKMVSTMEGQEWKSVRAVISPTFTTGKIRRMFEHFNKCGSQLVEFVKSKPVGSPGKRDVVVKEAFSRYLVDVIGATAFGLETNSLKDPNSMFYKMSQRQSEFSLMKLAKVILVMFAPFLTRFGLRFTDSDSMDFFEKICTTALKNRESSKEKREDFLQMMIEARRGELKTDESELDTFEKDAQLEKAGEQHGKAKALLTDEVITAQSMLFFLAGLDTTGSVLCFGVYLLALHPDVQNKLYEEISKVMKDKDGQIDYDSIVHMEYMDKFISEILRMYPPGTRIERRCTKDYKLPGTSDLIIEKDTVVFMAVSAMHHDPQYYPNPGKFDPERFTKEEKEKRNPYTYLPFGQGPRNCLGMRFALMEAKIAIAYLVYNFSIEPCESTPVPIKIDPHIGSRPIVELELRFKARD